MLPNAAPPEDTASPVYFLHIPKTGGTTFHNFLASQFDAKEVCPAHLWRELIVLRPERIASYPFIWGHFYAYLCRHVPTPTRYVTMLRDPVERALSHYGHVMLHEGHYLHRRAKEIGDFGSYLRDPELATTLSNFQVKSLALDLDPGAIAATLSAEQLANFELERRLETADALPEAEMLSIAKRRLEQMCFVGICEQLDESLALLCRKFDWQMPARQVEWRNVNETRIRAGELRDSDLALLRKSNEADYELYDFARRVFAREFERAAPASGGAR